MAVIFIAWPLSMLNRYRGIIQLSNVAIVAKSAISEQFYGGQELRLSIC